MPRTNPLTPQETQRQQIMRQLRHDCGLRLAPMATIGGTTESTLYGRERTSHATIAWPPAEARRIARALEEHFNQCASRCRRAQEELP